MKQSIYTLVALLFFVGFTNAQTAEQWLNEVSNRYKKNVTYYIKFESELKNKKTGVNQKDVGEVYTNKQKYNLSALGVRQIYNGNKLYTIDEEVQEVVITKPEKNSNDLMTPTKVLDSYKKGYKLSLDSKKTIGGKNIQFIKLVPEKKSAVKYYLVGIDTKTKLLFQYKEVNTQNTETTITIKKYIENPIVSKAYFKFDKEKYKKDGYFITE